LKMARYFVIAAAAACFAAFLPMASANATVPVSFGTSWDGPGKDLQSIVDALYGPGKLNVKTDYIGAHAADPDPWFWVGDHFPAMLLKEVAGNANRNTIGWYTEPVIFHAGQPPVLYNDNIRDGIVFDGPAGAGAQAVITFRSVVKFGFYMNPNGPLNATNAPEPEKFWTNRFYNDLGPDGSGALHPPFDGDVQALVFDISKIVNVPDTWLVAFEDLDSGANPGPSSSCQTDNDYNDLVFELTALGATPVQPMSFGQLKARYLH
jgi:hypothetical protein